MKKLIASLTFLTILASCSEKSQENRTRVNLQNDNIIYATEEINYSGGTLSPTNINLQAEEGSSAEITISLTNKTGSTTMSYALNGVTDTVVSETGICGPTWGNRRSCYLKVIYTPVGDDSQSGSLDVTINGNVYSFPMSLTGSALAPPPAEGDPLVTLGDELRPTPSSADLGEVLAGATNSLRISLRSYATGTPVIIDSTDLEALGYSVSHNCPNPLGNRRVCYVDISYTAASSILADNIVGGNLLISNALYAVTILEKASVEEPPVDPNACLDASSLIVYATEADVTNGDVDVLIKNNGNIEGKVCIQENTLPAHFVIVDGCQNPLRPKRTCTLTFQNNSAPYGSSHTININTTGSLDIVTQIRTCDNVTDLQEENPLITDITGIDRVTGDFNSGCDYLCQSGYAKQSSGCVTIGEPEVKYDIGLKYDAGHKFK